jgi:NAD(P)-dependent dehydrogenase (short-subunit alcohol dehydrogenase family)
MKYQMNQGCEAQKVYVLGAREGSGNIGEAIANRMFDEGWNVTGDDGAQHPDDGSRPRGGNMPNDDVARRHGYNITEHGRYQRFEAPAVQTFQQADPDALVVSMGRTSKDHFTEIPDWDIRHLITANLILPLEAARRFVQATDAGLNQPQGELKDPRHIIFIGSYGYEHPFTAGTSYCAAKAGLDMAARTLGWELTNRGYRVHIIHPWHVEDSPMWDKTQELVGEARGWTREEADDYAFREERMPRRLSTRDIAEVAHALLTVPAFEWMSGQSVKMYGGVR